MKPSRVDIGEKVVSHRTEFIQVSLQKPDNLRAIGKPKLDKPKNSHKQDMLKRIVEIFEPIRTKVANW